MYGTTVRIFQVLCATVMKQRMEELKALTMAIQMVVGGMLSKDVAASSKEYQEEIERALARAQREPYGQTEEEIAEIEDTQNAIEVAKRESLTEGQKARKGLINAIKADAIFKKLTGVHQTLPTLSGVNNPAMLRSMDIASLERMAESQADSLMRQNDVIAKQLLAAGHTKERTRQGSGTTGW